ncbi:NAD-dependent deacylase [Thermosulfurimonas marina]|uniref:NAD-dependent protein deacylase n=1 Tax=Thermosulfurimonas marina TaxID=2047767 RepID=A0A6H1WRU9_9BACT|nr:NAD-dependent deacylase [Thermosulfurimonas marina]QJA05945.1 NAD-dependent deacylase [Thermosulfurimonas marina]
MRFQRLVILTGAGISAESGIPTFRDPGGLWERYSLEEVATPEGFRRNPRLVHEFYNARRRDLLRVRPNPAHRALAELERRFPGEVLLVTQNVDDLHERAGSKRVLHIHGELLKVRCEACGGIFREEGEVFPETPCPACGKTGGLRPHVVWFGEEPFYLPEVYEALLSCDLFVAIGTSGTVWPAAGFVEVARRAGAHCVEINLKPAENAHLFQEHRYGPASREVPKWVEEILREGR